LRARQVAWDPSVFAYLLIYANDQVDDIRITDKVVPFPIAEEEDEPMGNANLIHEMLYLLLSRKSLLIIDDREGSESNDSKPDL
jgi:hypothetical protein